MQQKENFDTSNRPREISIKLNNSTSSFIHHESICTTHKLEMGKLFCQSCLRYDLCQECYKKDHFTHNVMAFANFNEAKEGTKEILLYTMEETLKQLKSKENEVQNRCLQIQLVRDRLKNLENQVLSSVRSQFDELQRVIAGIQEIQQTKYQRELDQFYEEYHRVNDYLRCRLQDILEGKIQMKSFDSSWAYKKIDDDKMPHFGRIKLVLQRNKKYFREVAEQVRNLEKVIRMANADQNKNSQKYDKYDKFLKDKTSYESEYNSSLMKTLNIIQNSQTNLVFFKSRLKN